MKKANTRKSRLPKSRIYDSMAAASGGMGFSMRSLREAKERGCPAFRSNRIHADELLQWWSDQFAEYDFKIPPDQVVEIMAIIDMELGTR